MPIDSVFYLQRPTECALPTVRQTEREIGNCQVTDRVERVTVCMRVRSVKRRSLG